MIVYRELLKKYIEHVGNCEGIDFLNVGYSNKTLFTEDEWEELLGLSVENLNCKASRNSL